jgi:O-antigen/teichoic acid export membrane protein
LVFGTTIAVLIVGLMPAPRSGKPMSRVLFSIGAVQVLIIVVGIGRSKILSILLGPAGFGVVSTIDQVVQTLMTLGALALPFTAMKFMSRSHSEGPEIFDRTYRSFLRILTLLILAATALASAALVLWPELFGRDMLAYRIPLQIAILGVPAVALNILLVNTLAAAQRPAAGATLNLLVLLSLAIGAIAGQRIAGFTGLYVAVVITGFLTTVATMVYLRRRLGVRIVGTSESLFQELKHSPEIVSYAAYIYVVLSVYQLALLATRYFVFSRLGEVEAGLLQALLSIALTVGAVLTPMSGLYLAPLVNRQLPVAEKVRAANDFAGKILILLLVASLPVILFPRLVLTILFTGKFAVGAEAMFVFVLWQCLYQVVNVYQQLLIGLDDMLFVCVAACVGFGGAALLTPLFISRFGLGGAALALTVGMAAYGTASAIRLRRRFASSFPAAVLLRAAYMLVVVVLAGVILKAGTERTLAGVAERLAFASTALGVFWILLGQEEKSFVRSGIAMLTLRARAHP